jgi:hypothetical protein
MAYLTASDIRAAYPNAKGLQDGAKITDTQLDDLIAEFAEIAELYRGVAYEPRTVTGEQHRLISHTQILELANREVRSISSVTVDGVALTDTDYVLDGPAGRILYTPGFWSAQLVLFTYVHGLGARQVTDGVTDTDTSFSSATAAFVAEDQGKKIAGAGIPDGTTIATVTDSTHVVLSAETTAAATGVTVTIGGCPNTLLRACREYVRSCALADSSNVTRDVIGQSADGGYTRYSTPDMRAGRPTGYLEVDRLLNSLRDYRVFVG